MARTPQEQKLFELRCYGCTTEQLEKFIDGCSETHWGYKMIAISLLSDAQESMSFGNHEYARQMINRAKYIVDHYLTEVQNVEAGKL